MKAESYSTVTAALVGARITLLDSVDRLRVLRDLASDVREGVVDQKFATRACLAVIAQALTAEVAALDGVARDRLPRVMASLQDVFCSAPGAPPGSRAPR